jgi:hypothetical protein
MNRKQDRRLVAGSMVAAGIAAIIVGIGWIGGYSSPAAGDTVAAPIGGLALAGSLAVALTLLSIDRAFSSSRRAILVRALTLRRHGGAK